MTAAQEGHNTVIAHPGQNVELLCSIGETTGGMHNIGWLVDGIGPFGVNSLLNGILDGYSAHAHTTSIIILNITMNDSRNGTEYRCGIIRDSFLAQENDSILLYVTGEFQ